MTLRAWIITMRGRIREALVPELQVLRQRLAKAESLAEKYKWQTIHTCTRAEKAEAEVERLLNNARVLTDAVWKACGDDESVVHDTIASQGDLK